MAARIGRSERIGRAGGRCNDAPVIESSGAGENANTSFRWVRLSWFIDLEHMFILKSGDEAVQLIQGIVDLAPTVGNLASVLATELIRRTRLDLKQREEPRG